MQLIEGRREKCSNQIAPHGVSTCQFLLAKSAHIGLHHMASTHSSLGFTAYIAFRVSHHISHCWMLTAVGITTHAYQPPSTLMHVLPSETSLEFYSYLAHFRTHAQTSPPPSTSSTHIYWVQYLTVFPDIYCLHVISNSTCFIYPITSVIMQASTTHFLPTCQSLNLSTVMSCDKSWQM